jgi:hypothetical protein
VTEFSKYVQTGKFDPAVVDAQSQAVAELQFLAASSQQEIASQWFPDRRPSPCLTGVKGAG